mgnify:CR=1 FL=1
MQYPKTIIELDDYFTKDKIEKFFKLMNEHFELEKNDIKIFDANTYITQSSFSSEIYDQVFKDLAQEHAGDGYN